MSLAILLYPNFLVCLCFDSLTPQTRLPAYLGYFLKTGQKQTLANVFLDRVKAILFFQLFLIPACYLKTSRNCAIDVSASKTQKWIQILQLVKNLPAKPLLYPPPFIHLATFLKLSLLMTEIVHDQIQFFFQYTHEWINPSRKIRPGNGHCQN